MHRTSHARRVAVLLLAVALAIYGADFARDGAARARASPRSAELTFAPDVTPGDRAVILDSIARARPEARALIAEVAGQTTVEVAQPEGGVLGLTEWTPDATRITLDLGAVSRALGRRGIDRVVLHELGHAVDFSLLDGAQRRAFDAGIPTGWGCDAGLSGGCAKREERFAESFAKWATGDIGVNLNAGYKVPPPTAGLEAWGRPLQRRSLRMR